MRVDLLGFLGVTGLPSDSLSFFLGVKALRSDFLVFLEVTGLSKDIKLMLGLGGSSFLLET